MSTWRDIEIIREAQAKILANQAKTLEALTSPDAPVLVSIGVASESAAAAAASCNASLEVLKEIAATLTQIATGQAAMAADLAAIKETIVPSPEPPPDTNPVGIVAEPDTPTERP